MAYAVMGAWVVQAALGFVLVRGWLRAGRRGPGVVVGHVAIALASLALWTLFAVTGSVALAWTAFATITVGNVLGDTLMVRRSRRRSPGAGWRDAVGDVFGGRMPALVVAHALFAGVVYLASLGVAIGATVAG